MQALALNDQGRRYPKATLADIAELAVCCRWLLAQAFLVGAA
jgi:hypothetical protein